MENAIETLGGLKNIIAAEGKVKKAYFFNVIY